MIQPSKIKSSALGYAIAFMLLVGLVTSGVLFISSANKRIEVNYSIQEHLLFNNQVSLLLGAKKETQGLFQVIHSTGDTTEINKKSWGAYDVVVAKTFNGNQAILKSGLTGNTFIDPLPALYLPNQRQVVKLCGDTKIEGTVYLSERGLERGYIAGTNYKNDKLLYGIQKLSDRNLPSLKDHVKNLSLDNFKKGSVNMDFVNRDTIFSFSEETKLVSKVETLIIQHNVSGNVIFHSFDKVLVSSSAKLHNVIIIAPEVEFESGFKGNVQVIAHKMIKCNDEVTLEYPSSLVLNELTRNDGDGENGISIGANSKVLGGVLLVSQNPNFRKPVQLRIDESAIIGGLVYNSGTTELKGKLLGHLYTNAFNLKVGGGQYGNHLLNTTISSRQLPDNFILPNWLSDQKVDESKIIKCF